MRILHFIFALMINFIVSTNNQTTLQSITLTEPLQIELQLGQNYQELVPKYFGTQQSASLSSLIHQNDVVDLNQGDSLPFQILTKRENTLIRSNQLYHYGLQDPDEYFSGDKKIYHFADIKKLIGVLDVTQFNHQVIVLFQSGYYSFYSIEEESQQLTLIQTKRLLSNITNITIFDRLSYSPAALNFWGNFVKSQDGQQLIFIGEEKAFLFNKEKRSFEQLKHETSLLGPNLQKAIILGDQIICAAGEKGLRIYKIDFEIRQLKFSRYFKPSIVGNNQSINQRTELRPVDIVYDYESETLIILDYQEGIFWIKIPQQKGTVILKVESEAVLVENCQSLQIASNTKMAVALCPDLMIIDLQTRTHTFVQDLDFVPTQISINTTKVYLFSKYQYAIYDLVSKILEQGLTGYEIDFSLIVNQSILTVNQFYIAKAIIVPEINTFQISMSQSSNLQFIGLSQLYLELQGPCSDLLSQQQILNQSIAINSRSELYNTNKRELQRLSQLKKASGKCKISQPIILKVVNSSKPSHLLQIIISSSLGGILILLGVYFWYQNRRIKKSYQALIQQKKTIKVESEVQSAYNLSRQAKMDM